MPNPLSHIYKIYQIYENNWTQLYNKTILYKKVQDCIQINKNKSKKPLNPSKCLTHRRSVSFKFTGIQNSIKLSHVSHHFMGNTHWFRVFPHLTGEHRTSQTSQHGRGSAELVAGEALTLVCFSEANWTMAVQDGVLLTSEKHNLRDRTKCHEIKVQRAAAHIEQQLDAGPDPYFFRKLSLLF